MDQLITWMKTAEGQAVGWMFTLVFFTAGAFTWAVGRKLQTLGRIKMRKKYRFHQVTGEGPNLILHPDVLGESDRFRDMEKIRNTIAPAGTTVALLFEPEVVNAQI